MLENERNLPDGILKRKRVQKQNEQMHVIEENNERHAIETEETQENAEGENKEPVLSMPRFDRVSISEDGWARFTGKVIQVNENISQKEKYLNGYIMKSRMKK